MSRRLLNLMTYKKVNKTWPLTLWRHEGNTLQYGVIEISRKSSHNYLYYRRMLLYSHYAEFYHTLSMIIWYIYVIYALWETESLRKTRNRVHSPTSASARSRRNAFLKIPPVSCTVDTVMIAYTVFCIYSHRFGWDQ